MATTDKCSLQLGRSYCLAAVLGSCACLIAVFSRPRVDVEIGAAVGAILLILWILQWATRWVWWFFFAALLTPPLPIALGNSGPHVGIAFAALGLLSGALRIRSWRIERNLLTLALAAFSLLLLCSSAIAAFYSGLDVAAGSLTRVLLFSIGVYVFFYCAHGPGRPSQASSFSGARRLYWFGVLSAAFACVDFYLQLPAPAGYGPQFIWLDSGVYRRAQGVFYEASTLGNVCAFFLVMIAVRMLHDRHKWNVSMLVQCLGAPLLFAALILSYSRGSLLNLLAALAALLYLERRRIRIGRMLVIAGSSIAAGSIAAWILFPEVTWSYWLRLVHAEFFFSQPEIVLSGRLSHWQTLVAFLRSHPWHAMLGIGYKTLPYSNFIGQATVADNMYLDLLAETGVAGLCAFVLLNLAIVRAAWTAAHSDDTRRSFFGTWTFCFWVGQLVQMFSGDLFTYWRVLPLYFWALAMAVQ